MLIGTDASAQSLYQHKRLKHPELLKKNIRAAEAAAAEAYAAHPAAQPRQRPTHRGLLGWGTSTAEEAPLAVATVGSVDLSIRPLATTGPFALAAAAAADWAQAGATGTDDNGLTALACAGVSASWGVTSHFMSLDQMGSDQTASAEAEALEAAAREARSAAAEEAWRAAEAAAASFRSASRRPNSSA